MATFMTSTLSSGSHTITAVYSGDTNFGGSTSAPLIQQVGAPADSVKLRELQISATPIIAQGWGQAVSAAMDDAVTAGFGGNPQSLSPAGTGFTYYFNDDPPARSQVSSDQDSLRRYLASPNGNSSAPDAKSLDAKSAAANDSTKRVDAISARLVMPAACQPRRRRRPPAPRATGSPGSMCAAPITSAAPSATISRAIRSMPSPD